MTEVPQAARFGAVALRADRATVSQVSWNPDGLVAVVAVDAGSGEVLMLAWMDAEALRLTLESGRAWYWSRSRRELWCKGETSGDRQWVREVRLDCDGDAIVLVVEQEGRGACHTGERTCFHRVLARPYGGQALPR
ncbi:MAG: phosphoribosyl-AMP cyclohydrolase [Acidimicrobiales bacterium]